MFEESGSLQEKLSFFRKEKTESSQIESGIVGFDLCEVSVDRKVDRDI